MHPDGESRPGVFYLGIEVSRSYLYENLTAMNLTDLTDAVSLPIVDRLITLLMGIFIGVASTYLAAKYTDKRKYHERNAELRNRFDRCRSAMPELFEEMKQDISKTLKSEFVILNHRYSYGRFPDEPLEYYTGTGAKSVQIDNNSKIVIHADLLDKVKMLENNGFVVDVSRTDVPYFRMNEDFIQLLKDMS